MTVGKDPLPDLFFPLLSSRSESWSVRSVQRILGHILQICRRRLSRMTWKRFRQAALIREWHQSSIVICWKKYNENRIGIKIAPYSLLVRCNSASPRLPPTSAKTPPPIGQIRYFAKFVFRKRTQKNSLRQNHFNKINKQSNNNNLSERSRLLIGWNKQWCQVKGEQNYIKLDCSEFGWNFCSKWLFYSIYSVFYWINKFCCFSVDFNRTNLIIFVLLYI